MHISENRIYLSDGDVISVRSTFTAAELCIRADEGKLVVDSTSKYGDKGLVVSSDEWIFQAAFQSETIREKS